MSKVDALVDTLVKQSDVDWRALWSKYKTPTIGALVGGVAGAGRRYAIEKDTDKLPFRAARDAVLGALAGGAAGYGLDRVGAGQKPKADAALTLENIPVQPERPTGPNKPVASLEQAVTSALGQDPNPGFWSDSADRALEKVKDRADQGRNTVLGSAVLGELLNKAWMARARLRDHANIIQFFPDGKSPIEGLPQKELLDRIATETGVKFDTAFSEAYGPGSGRLGALFGRKKMRGAVDAAVDRMEGAAGRFGADLTQLRNNIDALVQAQGGLPGTRGAVSDPAAAASKTLVAVEPDIVQAYRAGTANSTGQGGNSRPKLPEALTGVLNPEQVRRTLNAAGAPIPPNVEAALRASEKQLADAAAQADARRTAMTDLQRLLGEQASEIARPNGALSSLRSSKTVTDAMQALTDAVKADGTVDEAAFRKALLMLEQADLRTGGPGGTLHAPDLDATRAQVKNRIGSSKSRTGFGAGAGAAVPFVYDIADALFEAAKANREAKKP